MKNLYEASCRMFEETQKENFLFFIFDPDEPDSTSNVNLSLKLKIMGLKGYAEEFSLTPETAVSIVPLIESIFEANKKPIIGYNLKNFYTFVKRITGKEFKFKTIFDLYWYESYVRLDSTRGKIKDSIKNVMDLAKNTKLLSIYKEIYIPLITQVLPQIESFAFRHEEKCVKVYSKYILEGQENGRLLCNSEKKYSFNPHTMSEEKSNIKFLTKYKYFLQFDYRNMEVSVLAELAQDNVLLDIIESKRDVYSSIFTAITGLDNFENAREYGKKLFLPLIYGQTSNSLAKILDISYEQADNYCKKARDTFKKSFEYVESYAENARTQNMCKDVFYRVRNFEISESYKARNFCIQSPSALICLYYLVKLYMASGELYSLAFHVHDGYFIATRKENVQEAYQVAKQVLESSNKFLPNLKLLTSSKVGTALDKMFPINAKERCKT